MGNISRKVIAAALLVFSLTVLHGATAAADYNSSNLISDPVFRDRGSMSVDDIQSFLAARGSGLAGFHDTEDCGSPSGSHYSYYTTYYSCGQSVLASKIIYDVAQAYNMSPRVILATLQKEQSLVTTPNPTASQLQCAMGYLSCGGYVGFFTQVENGTWQFRTYVELMNGNNWWGYVPSQYPCNDSAAGIAAHDPGGNNKKFYYPGLYPGRGITFYDYYGDAYANFTLANSATAAMYCYTPHVYPGSPNVYYSGSYNFVYWFERWFGSTQNIVPRYTWTLTGQQAFTDSSRTIPYTDGVVSVVPAGGKAYLRIQARNNSNQTWTRGSMRLGTNNPRERASIFADSSWLTSSRIDMAEASVLPGDIGTFEFSITAPQAAGSYKEYFNLLQEGVTWMNDLGLYYQIDVVAPVAASNTQNTGLASGQALTPGNFLLSPDRHSTLQVQGDGNVVMYSNFKPAWATKTSSSKATTLVMQTDGNLVLYDSSGVALWASGTSGHAGAGAHLVTQADGNLVIYIGTTPLWATYTTLSVPDQLHRVDKTQWSGSNLFVGQKLETADRKYYMTLQADGNLVLYSPNRAIWSSGTAGKTPAFLAMQGDGNLVLYDTDGRAIWYSGAGGRGSSALTIQADGNLVTYAANGSASWATNTAGVQ